MAISVNDDVFLFFQTALPVPVIFWLPRASLAQEPLGILIVAVNTPEPPVAAAGVQPERVPLAVNTWFFGVF